MSLREAMAGPFVQITVGEPGNSETFILPKALLCKSSTYFQAALNNGFEETHTQKITLDDEDPEVFRTFATWLYQNELNQETLERGYLLKKSELEMHLILLGVFAEKRGVRKLKNDNFTMLSSFLDTRGKVENENINNILPSIPTDSALFTLLVDDSVCHGKCYGADLEDIEGLPKSYIARLLEASFNGVSERHPFDSICEDYHDHLNEDEKLSCQCSIEEGKNVYQET